MSAPVQTSGETKPATTRGSLAQACCRSAGVGGAPHGALVGSLQVPSHLTTPPQLPQGAPTFEGKLAVQVPWQLRNPLQALHRLVNVWEIAAVHWAADAVMSRLSMVSVVDSLLA